MLILYVISKYYDMTGKNKDLLNGNSRRLNYGASVSK